MVWTNENNDVVILSFGTAILILLAIGFVSFYLLYQKRLLKEKNKIQSLELDLHNKVLASIIDTQEIERKRLSEDLHDELGALIMALRLNSHDLLNDCGKDEDIRKRMKENEQLIESIAERVRTVSHNLLPPSLKMGHLEDALTSLCHLFMDNTKLHIVYDKEEELFDIPLKDQLALYRVVNEWFTNVVKHSGANIIHVDFHRNPTSYKLTISDNGNGFDYEKSMLKTNGLGLMSIRGRLINIGARFNFKENEPKGTKFEVLYPIKT